MLDPKLIRTDLTKVASLLKTRGVILDTATLTALEEKRKQLQTHLQTLQNERNTKSKAIGTLKAQGQSADDIFVAVKQINESLKKTEEDFNQIQEQLNQLLAVLPNLPHESTPIGKDETGNQVVRTVGTPKHFSFTPKDHVDLGLPLGMDFAAGSKLSGARFVVLKNKLARLQRALIQMMLDIHVKEHGYQEIYVPAIVNADSLFGTGQLPKLKEDLFQLNGENNYYLIPTSEVPVTNLLREELLEANQIPERWVCYSPCFRSEAGSYGKDTRGMIRNHQFEKVELVHIVHPDKSYETLETLTQHAETILQRLELPYRVVALCTGDLGFASAKTYDLEVWLPSQQMYREISSCSNMEAFQARRLKARFKDDKGKIEFVHTLNGSGLAVGRTLVALLENYQDEKGRIHIPKALQPYFDHLSVLE